MKMDLTERELNLIKKILQEKVTELRSKSDYYQNGEVQADYFETDVLAKKLELKLEKNNYKDLDSEKIFTYEKFCEYVRNKMSAIYVNEDGQYQIVEDTQALQEITPDELGYLTEEETLGYIYNNNLFEKVDEIIDKTPSYIYNSSNFEEVSNKIKNFPSIESELNSEDELEDDWELEQ